MEGRIVLLLAVVGVLMISVAEGLECYSCEYSKQGDIVSGDEKCLSNPTSVNVTKCSEESPPACFKNSKASEDTGFKSVARGCSFVDQAPSKHMKCNSEDQGDRGEGTYCFCDGDKCNSANPRGYYLNSTFFILLSVLNAVLIQAFLT